MSQPVTTTLPIEAVTFNNVTITIASTDPATAYAVLCQTLSGTQPTPIKLTALPANPRNKALRYFSPQIQTPIKTANRR
jgi:hypothetical protein